MFILYNLIIKKGTSHQCWSYSCATMIRQIFRKILREIFNAKKNMDYDEFDWNSKKFIKKVFNDENLKKELDLIDSPEVVVELRCLIMMIVRNYSNILKSNNKIFIKSLKSFNLLNKILNK